MKKFDLNVKKILKNWEISIEKFYFFKKIHLNFHRSFQVINMVHFLQHYRIFFPGPWGKFAFNFEFNLKNVFHFLGLHHFINKLDSVIKDSDFQQKIIKDFRWNYSKFIENIIENYVFEKTEKCNFPKKYWDIKYSSFLSVNKTKRIQLAHDFFYEFIKIVINNNQKVQIKAFKEENSSFLIEKNIFFSGICFLKETTVFENKYSEIYKKGDTENYIVFSLKINNENIIILCKKSETPVNAQKNWKWINFISISPLSKEEYKFYKNYLEEIKTPKISIFLDKIPLKVLNNEKCSTCGDKAFFIKEMHRKYFCYSHFQ